MAELHVDASTTKDFESVRGSWMMFGFVRSIAAGERSASSSSTDGGVHVLDERP